MVGKGGVLKGESPEKDRFPEKNWWKASGADRISAGTVF